MVPEESVDRYLRRLEAMKKARRRNDLLLIAGLLKTAVVYIVYAFILCAVGVFLLSLPEWIAEHIPFPLWAFPVMMVIVLVCLLIWMWRWYRSALKRAQ